jgi:hypothetical protein
MLSNCTYSVCQVIGILKITYLFKLYKTWHFHWQHGSYQNSGIWKYFRTIFWFLMLQYISTIFAIFDFRSVLCTERIQKVISEQWYIWLMVFFPVLLMQYLQVEHWYWFSIGVLVNWETKRNENKIQRNL